MTAKITDVVLYLARPEDHIPGDSGKRLMGTLVYGLSSERPLPRLEGGASVNPTGRASAEESGCVVATSWPEMTAREVGRRVMKRRRHMTDESSVVTVGEAARPLGISRGLAYDLVRQGEIPSIRLGRRVVVPRRRPMVLSVTPHTEMA